MTAAAINDDHSMKTIIDLIKGKLGTKLEPKIQVELANLLSLAEQLKCIEDTGPLIDLEVAVQALLSDGHNLELARSIRQNVSFRINRTKHPATWVVFGLATVLFVIGMSFLVFTKTTLTSPNGLILGLKKEILLGVSIAGGIGSIVSIMVRIKDFGFENEEGNCLTFMFIGFFKPIIGIAFALFVFVAIKSDIIPIKIKEGTEEPFFLALAFISGFSERFVRDIVSKTENKFKGTEAV